jgi:hypothetical protein
MHLFRVRVMPKSRERGREGCLGLDGVEGRRQGTVQVSDNYGLAYNTSFKNLPNVCNKSTIPKLMCVPVRTHILNRINLHSLLNKESLTPVRLTYLLHLVAKRKQSKNILRKIEILPRKTTKLTIL